MPRDRYFRLSGPSIYAHQLSYPISFFFNLFPTLSPYYICTIYLCLIKENFQGWGGSILLCVQNMMISKSSTFHGVVIIITALQNPVNVNNTQGDSCRRKYKFGARRLALIPKEPFTLTGDAQFLCVHTLCVCDVVMVIAR